MNIRYEDLDRIIVSLEKRAEPKASKARISYVKGTMAWSRLKRISSPVFHLKSV